ncbi:hypothetical protein Tco_0813182, partial [Tanacetum coccineum]
ELRNELLCVQNGVDVNEISRLKVRHSVPWLKRNLCSLLSPTVQLTVSTVVPSETDGESVLREASDPMTNMIVTTLVNVTGAPVTNIVANHAEKPEKFNRQNVKRWQQKMFFYLRTLNFARFLNETTPQVEPTKEGHGRCHALKWKPSNEQAVQDVWSEWDPFRARVRGNRDCKRGFPFADAGRSADGLRKRYPTSITSAYFKSHSLVDIVLYTCRHLAALRIYYAKGYQEHSVKRDDVVLEETIAKDVSEVAVEKTKKSKRKRKTAGDATTFPPKKLREDYHAAASNIGGKSLAAIRDLVPDGSSVPSEVTEPPTVVYVLPTLDDGPTNSMYGLNLQTCPPYLRYVVSSDDSHHSGSCSEVKSFAKSPATDVPVTTVAVTTTVTANVSAVPTPKVRVVFKNLETFGDYTSAGGANADAAGTSKLNEPADSLDSFYVPKWNMTNDSVLDDPYVCRDLTDRLALPALFSQLRAMDYDQLYFEFNVGEVRLEDKCSEQAALLSERDAEIVHLKSLLSFKEAEAVEAIRLRSQISVIEAADVAKGDELMDLKERNFVLEGEKDALFEKVKTLESEAALKKTELSHDELSSTVASLEFKRDSLVAQRIEATLDEQAKVLGNRVAELDAHLLEMTAHLDEEFYPHFLIAISGRRWILTHRLKLVIHKCLQSLKYCHALGLAIGCAVNKGIQDGLRAGIDHGKAGMDLSVIEAYDPSAEAKYVESVNALGAVDFSLLSELNSKKDARIVNLMDSLRLEGPLAEIPGAEDLQPSLEQLRLPIHRPEDNVVLGETSLSLSLQVVHSRVQRSLIGEASTSAGPSTAEPVTALYTTFASSKAVPPLLISNDQTLDTEPNDTDPPAMIVEKEESATSPE